MTFIWNRSRRHHWQGPSCLKKLYRLLLEPLEDDLPEGYPGEIMLVLDADLYLVPFAMLKAPTAQVIQHANPTSYFYFKCCFTMALLRTIFFVR